MKQVEMKCEKCGQMNKMLVEDDAYMVKCAYCANPMMLAKEKKKVKKAEKEEKNMESKKKDKKSDKKKKEDKKSRE